MKLVLLTRSLEVGGAERQIVTLAKALHNRGCKVMVATFYPGGALESDLQAADIPVKCLNKAGTWDNIIFLIRLVRFLKSERTDVLHSYLGTPNLMAFIAKLFLPHMKIIWGVRDSKRDLSSLNYQSRLSYWLECQTSRFADRIIANSIAGKDFAVTNGFPESRTIVIPNGIDISHFKPDPISGQRLRLKWGVRTNERLIGVVGRLDPLKDHATFLKAASVFSSNTPDVRFVIVGDGDELYRSTLERLAKDLNLGDRLIWAGSCSNMVDVYNTLDITTSSSLTEGFSNVIGEAMACGVPCVVTDVGDSAWIVGNTGIVVPPRHPDAIAEGWAKALAFPIEVRHLARLRVVECFSVESLVAKTEAALTF